MLKMTDGVTVKYVPDALVSAHRSRGFYVEGEDLDCPGTPAETETDDSGCPGTPAETETDDSDDADPEGDDQSVEPDQAEA